MCSGDRRTEGGYENVTHEGVEPEVGSGPSFRPPRNKRGGEVPFPSLFPEEDPVCSDTSVRDLNLEVCESTHEKDSLLRRKEGRFI